MAEKVKVKKGFWQGIRETIYGMAAHDMSRASLRCCCSIEDILILITMCYMLGIDMLGPYY